MSTKKNILLIFLILSTILNSSKFYGGKFDRLNMFYPYYQNDVIVLIAVVTIIINVLLISILIMDIANKNYLRKYRNFITFFLTMLLVVLIWFEIYYGSTFNYGEIRDKQALWYGANNCGAVGSIILTYSLYKFKFTHKKIEYTLEFLFLLSIVTIHFIILKSLNESWRIFF